MANLWEELSAELRKEIEPTILEEIERFKKKFQLSDDELEIKPSTNPPYVKILCDKTITIDVGEVDWEFELTISNYSPFDPDEVNPNPNLDSFPSAHRVIAKVLSEKLNGRVVEWSSKLYVISENDIITIKS